MQNREQAMGSPFYAAENDQRLFIHKVKGPMKEK